MEVNSYRLLFSILLIQLIQVALTIEVLYECTDPDLAESNTSSIYY